MIGLLEHALARLGWIVRCASCGRRLPYGTPPAHCHACHYGYVRAGTWTPAEDACVACHQASVVRHPVGGGKPGWRCTACHALVIAA